MNSQSQFYKEAAKGIWKENPVLVQLLGLCPALAVTNSAINGIVMGLATTFVLTGASFLVSAFRSVIPKQVRITTYIVVIATFVTVADLTLAAFLPDTHKELGAFIPLIVVNCMILGRAEAFASRHPLKPAMGDALGMAAGFTLALVMLGGIREILGSGSLFGVALFGAAFEPWVVMILPPGGFLTAGALLMLFAYLSKRRRQRAALQLRKEAA